MEILCESSTCFLDGTFKTSSNIFVQVFTIIGLQKRTGPLMKRSLQYHKTKNMMDKEVLEAVEEVVGRFMHTRQNHDWFQVSCNYCMYWSPGNPHIGLLLAFGSDYTYGIWTGSSCWVAGAIKGAKRQDSKTVYIYGASISVCPSGRYVQYFRQTTLWIECPGDLLQRLQRVLHQWQASKKTSTRNTA